MTPRPLVSWAKLCPRTIQSGTKNTSRQGRHLGIEAFTGLVMAARPDDPLAARLTPRERDVLERLATGLSNAEIGAALGIAAGTVNTHVNALLPKIGACDRVQATIVAYDLGLARPR